MTTCTVDTCELETDRYLCNDCTAELAEAMGKIPDLLPVLAMITRKEEQPFTVRANRGGGKPGPTTPLNLQSHALWETLTMATQMTPEQYAGDAEGAYAKQRIEDAVSRADLMVNGEEEQTVTDDYLKFRMTQIAPLPASELPDWFKKELGIEITVTRIRKWATRKYLTPVSNEKNIPRYHPKDVLNVLAKKEDAA